MAESSNEGRTKDRRAFVRRAVKGEVVCRLGKLGMGAEKRGKLVNLSQSGVLIAFPMELEVGQEIEIEFASAGTRKKTAVPAVVRRIESNSESTWHVGCEFDKRLPYQYLAEFAR